MMLVLLTIVAFNFEAGKLMLERKDSIYITRLLDSVKIYNDTMEIRGLSGVYNEVDTTLFIKGGVLLITPKRKVKSDSLVIRKNGDIILFMGKVVVIEDSDTLKAEEVFIEGDSISAISYVSGYFPSGNFKFNADTLYAIDSTYVLKGENVRIVTLDTDSIVLEGSPVYIKKDTLFSPSRCKVVTGKYRSEGDTLFYFKKDSIGFFLGNVEIMWDSGYATGDTAYFYVGDDGLDSLIVKGNCFLENKGKNAVKLRGKKFKVTLKNNKMVKLQALEAEGVLKREKDE